MASASTSAAIDSEPEDQNFIYADSEKEKEEDVEWIDAPFFPVEHMLDEYKSQSMKAMKELVIDDHVHKKLSSAFVDNMKLQKMQYVSLHFDLKNMKDEIENTKSK